MTEPTARVIDFVADLPLSSAWCSFNVLRKHGKHRQCDDYARVVIDGYSFCRRHAAIVEQSTDVEQNQRLRGMKTNPLNANGLVLNTIS